MHRETVAAKPKPMTVTISPARLAKLEEDKRILDLLDRKLFPKGQPTLRQRGREMLRSKAIIQGILEEFDESPGPLPRPARERPSRAS